MPFATPEVRAASWSESDYLTRFAEIRSEFGEAMTADPNINSESPAFRSVVNEVDALDLEMKMVRTAMVREARTTASNGGFYNPGGVDLSRLAEYRSIGQQVVENDTFTEWADRQSRSASPINSPLIELRTLVTEGTPGLVPGGVGGVLLPVGQPFIGNQRRQRLFIRDLITVQQTGLSGVPYVREASPTTTQTTASTVNEGGTKPEAAVQFTADFAPSTVIAVNIPITTQMAADAPTLMGYINSRLVYMLKLREEKEMLNGNGIYPDAKGILTYTGAGQLQTQTTANSDDWAPTIGSAIGKIEVADGMADGVVMNPADAWAMFIKRASTSGVFDAGDPFSAGVTDTVWGLPLVRSNSVASGTGVVGSWALGATWFDRQEANVKVYEQHSDFAAKNQMLVQAEERGALANFRPDWFVSCALT